MNSTHRNIAGASRRFAPLAGLAALLLGLANLSANITLAPAGTYETGAFDEGAAEISAYDPVTGLLFVINSNSGLVDVLDISNIHNPVKVNEVDAGGGINSVAISNGVLAVARDDDQNPGAIVFFDIAAVESGANTDPINEVPVGALPDMVTFTPDGSYLLAACEGEPDDFYFVDPEGSVAILPVGDGSPSTIEDLDGEDVMLANFAAFNVMDFSMKNRGIRQFGPFASFDQDVEPEYIAISADSSTAYVTLQENNALAVVDIAEGEIIDVLPLGTKDFSQGLPVLTEYFINELVDLPALGTNPLTGETIDLGGFSGLWFDATESTDTNYVFYTIPDRGPNGDTVADPQGGKPLRPFYTPDYISRIVKFSLNPVTGVVSFDENDQIFLTRTDGITPITGKGNIKGTDESPVEIVADNGDVVVNGTHYDRLSFDALGGDFEGILRDNAGNFWMCDEYRPAIYHFLADGTLNNRFVPIGTEMLPEFPPIAGAYGVESLPSVYNNRRANRGFEAIAYDSENEIIYAFIQTPLDNPDSGIRHSDVIRILGISAAGESYGWPVAEYVYLLESNRHRVAATYPSRVDKIGDAVYVGNGRFYVLERDSSVPGDLGKKFIFEIDLTGATNILATPLSEDAVGSTLESMTADMLDEVGVQPVFKRKVLNLSSIGYFPSDKPEGLAMLPGGSLAVVNDNDFGTTSAGVSDTISLGIIDFVAPNGLDASDRDDAINITNWPLLGMFNPDAIDSFEVGGMTYLITANEGDARDYETFSEEDRVKDLMLDPTAFPDAATLQQDENIGRKNSTTVEGDLDSDGDHDRIFVFGTRSISIWDAIGNLVWDSGSTLEEVVASVNPDDFNSTNDENDSFDNRSDNKGPEPEGVEIGKVGSATYAFVGLERQGGIAVFDVSNPQSPSFVHYVNNRDFSGDAEAGTAGDLGPEGLVFISAADSPSGQPLLVVTNEISGSTTIYEVLDRSAIFKFTTPPFAGGYQISAWMDLLWTRDYPWVYQKFLGWLRAFPIGQESVWFQSEVHGWFWTDPQTFPMVFSNTTSRWYHVDLAAGTITKLPDNVIVPTLKD